MSNHPNRSRWTKTLARSPTPEEIRQLRENANLTQDEAAKLVHSTWKSWQKWEYGERPMHPTFWELFCRKVTESRADNLEQIHPERSGLE